MRIRTSPSRSVLSFRWLGLVLLMAPWSAIEAQEDSVPDPPEGLVFERDLAYREGHPRWVLNVIYPRRASPKPRPAVLLIHGGAWAMGDQYRFTRMGFQLASEGYVVILPTYRLFQDAPFPACLVDIKNAIRWTRAHAERYQIDPERIGAYGNSAGGTLALSAALTHGVEDFEGDGSHREHSSDLQAIVASGAVGDMRDASHSDRAKSAYRNLATGGERAVAEEIVEERLRQASPASFVSGKAAPIMLVHGGRDEIVVIKSTDDFVKAMKQAGAEIDYLRFEEAGHGVMGEKAKETHPALMDFFQKHLGK